MQQMIKNTLLVVLSLAVTACVNSGGYNNVPVEDASSGQHSVFDHSDYPTQSSPAQNNTMPSDADSYPDKNYPSPDVVAEESVSKYKAPPARPGNNSAVIALLSSAQKQLQSGDYMRAAATLERAIRISPRDPELYYQLAQVRYLQRNYHQTEQLCRKAISLAGSDKKLLARCRLLLDRLR